MQQEKGQIEDGKVSKETAAENMEQRMALEEYVR